MASSSVKLENCEVCAINKANYTCPQCEVRTCSLTCVKIHKNELECNGIRDKVKFVPLNNFTDLDLLSDYRFLEEHGRSVERLQEDELLKCTRMNTALPPFLQRLRHAAYQRGTQLFFMPRSFTRNKNNTTYFNWKTHELFWRIEFIFPQAENVNWVYERVSETKSISALLEDVFNPNASMEESESISPNELVTLRERLQGYREAGIENVKVLLKAEKIKKSYAKFYELDTRLSLKESLKDKTIIEFPTIYVILKDYIDKFEIIDNDTEIQQHCIRNKNKSYTSGRKRKLPDCPLEKKKNTPVNFFFSDES